MFVFMILELKTLRGLHLKLSLLEMQVPNLIANIIIKVLGNHALFRNIPQKNFKKIIK